MKPPVTPADASRAPLERFLGLFSDVRAEEGRTSLLLLANIFLILTAYYLIKPIRDGWLTVSVIQGLTLVEVKAVSALGQTVVLLALLPVYTRIASRWSRRELVTGSGVFCGVMLVLFYLVQPGLIVDQVPYAGILFYLFVGIFNVGLVAQFWAFAADIFGPERGARIFPLIAIGATAGAVAGSWLGQLLLEQDWLGAYDLILLALIPLILAVVLARITDARGAYGHPSAWTTKRWEQPAAPTGDGGSVQSIFQHRYLVAAAFMILIFNCVLTGGDIILFGFITAMLEEQLAGQENFAVLMRNEMTLFYSDLYFWINIIGLILQSFVVSRLLRFGGFGLLILTTPLISLAASASIAVAPVIAVIKFMKIAEGSSMHSINNTARQMLWLPTTKAMLYQTKVAVDTLFVRLGDAVAAIIVLVGTYLWDLPLLVFLIVNAVFAFVWLLLARIVKDEHATLTSNNSESSTS